MNRLRLTQVTVGAVLCILCAAPAVFADEDAVTARAGIIRQGIAGTTFSVEVPVLARVQGSAFFRSLVAFTNNTNNTITVSYQFSYTCLAAACATVGRFDRTAVQTFTLPALGSFVQDDFIDYLNSLGILLPGAVQGSIGTLLVTFTNLQTNNGYEANVVARTYNRLVEADPNQGTVGFAYNASPFYDSSDTTLVGFARDTKSAPTLAGKLRSNLGIRNTDINGTNQNMTVDITFYDTATGQRVGNSVPFADLRPGEVRQISDIWTTAAIPSTVNSVIVFADSRTPTLTSPTMEGYVTIIDGQNTQDASLFTLICGDANGCGN